VQIRDATAYEGRRRDSVLRSSERVPNTIEHRCGRQWVVTSAVFLRLSFHDDVRMFFHHFANTIGLLHADEGGLVVLHLGWVPFAGEPTTTMTTILSWTNRVAIQCRLWTPVTVNRPERLNRRLPQLAAVSPIRWISLGGRSKSNARSGWASLVASCYAMPVKCVNRRTNRQMCSSWLTHQKLYRL